MATGVGNTAKQFRKLQIGKESTYGTEVAATRILRVIDLEWNDLASQRIYVPAYTIGRMSTHTDLGSVLRTGLTGRIETDFSFEDFLFFVLAGYKGAVVSVEKTATQGDREWIFKHSPTVFDPTPDSYTLEFRMTGAANFDRTVPGVLIQEIQLSFDQGGDVVKCSGSFWGRAANSNAITALTLPTPFTQLSTLGWKLYIDDTWTAMNVAGVAPSYGGGTQIATTVRRVTWTYRGGIDPALYIGDGRTDPSKHRPMPRGAELELECEFNSSLNTERTKAETPAKRFVRLLGEGARIGTGFNRTVLIQGCFQYLDGGFGPIGPDADGYDTVTLRLATTADDDVNDHEVRVINTLTTFP